MWTCRNCGNENEFKGVINYTTSGWEEQEATLDSEGEVVDYGEFIDSETTNSEINTVDINECGGCGSSDIHDIDGEEYEGWKEKYFKSDGTFVKEGLPKEIDKDGNVI